MFVLYLVGDLFYLILRTVFPYRRDTVLENLSAAFPNNSPEQNKKIFKQNQGYMADLLAEGVKGLSISKRALKKRMRFNISPDAERLLSGDESAILLGSHSNNWEMLILAQALLFPQKAIGIGKPLSKAFMDKKLNARRERFGMRVVNATNYSTEIQEYLDKGKQVSILVLADQAPHKTDKAYWTKHFGLDTPFSFGGESMAHKYNMPVYFVRTRRTSRGHYEVEVELISAEPRTSPYGFIMERYVHLLEEQIGMNIPRWLWTHRRWKHKAPEGLERIKQKHKAFFEEKYN